MLTSVVLDAGTLYITATATNLPGADYAADISVSIDDSTNEVVYTEANQPEQRFDEADVNRISFRGTGSNDRFLNQTNIESRILGNAGDDFLEGGTNVDRIIGGNGNDILNGGHGNDFLSGNKGADHLIDNRLEDSGNDRFFGGDGPDDIFAGLGDDLIAPGNGNDKVVAGLGADYIFPSEGNDNLNGGPGADIIFGGNGNDVINGGTEPDRLVGQDGDDRIHGNEHADTLLGGNGDDELNGDTGNDNIIGDDGNDELNGGPGSDRIQSATANVPDDSSGVDIIDTGDDNAVDRIIGHGVDQRVNRPNDVIINVSDVRANQQLQFLADNINNPGWMETASGLQYRSVVAGSGASPIATDRVRVNYVGTLTDGTQFDANDDISFFLTQVIAGWTEGLQLMKVGGTMEFAIPWDLAYGVNGRPNIPGRSVLLFTVDLLEINP